MQVLPDLNIAKQIALLIPQLNIAELRALEEIMQSRRLKLADQLKTELLGENS